MGPTTVVRLDVAWDSATPITHIDEKLYYPVLKWIRQDYVKASNRHFKVDSSSPSAEKKNVLH